MKKRVEFFGAGIAFALGIMSVFSVRAVQAYFTDKETVPKQTVDVGNMDIVTEPGKLLLDGKEYNKDSNVIIPGDTLDYSYNVYKTGNVDADVCEVVTLTVTPASEQTITNDDAKYFTITKADGTEIATNGTDTNAPVYVASSVVDGVLTKRYLINTSTAETTGTTIGTESKTNDADKTNQYKIKFAWDAGTGNGKETDDYRDTHLMAATVNADVDIYAVQQKNRPAGDANPSLDKNTAAVNFDNGAFSIFAPKTSTP